MPTLMDWVLLIVFCISLALIYTQGRDIDRLEQIMRIQNNINESLNNQLEALKKGRNWVDPGSP